MNALIVGGGVGGLTAAIALARTGWQVTLAEKLTRFEPAGAGIVLAQNASSVLSHLGVSLAGAGFELPALEVVTSQGRRLQKLDTTRLRDTHGPVLALTRTELHDRLLEALPASVVRRLGCTVEQIEEAPSSVRVKMSASPAWETYDLVVGADGLHSSIRTLLYGAQPYRYSGVTCWRGLMDNPGFSHSYEAWGGLARIGVVPVGKGKLYYFLVLTSARGTPELVWRDGFEKHFGHFKGEVGKLLPAMVEPPPLHHDLLELERPFWGRRRVFLLGDAAHAMTPNQGQGAAMAIEDAVALSRAVVPGLEGANERYVAVREKRVRRIQLDSRRLGSVAHWENPFACFLRNRLLAAMPDSFMVRQVRSLVEPGMIRKK